MSRLERRRFRAASLILAAVAIVGCTPDRDVVTLQTSGVTVDAVGPEEARHRAEEFYACMSDQGVPVVLRDGEYGQTWVDWDSDTVHRVLIRNADGTTSKVSFDSGVVGEPVPAEDEFLANDPGTWGLLVDGVDFSDSDGQCKESTNYVDPDLFADPATELLVKTRIVAATNVWADCARKNGLPTLADLPAPVADGYLTTPQLLIPGTISTDELSRLVAACPTTAERLKVTSGNPVETDPAIGLDFSTAPELPPADAANREDNLYAILFAPPEDAEVQ